jgi:hypothetical protein
MVSAAGICIWGVSVTVSERFLKRFTLCPTPLALTEARVRGAIKTLEAVGFLERSIPDPGSKYKAVGEGLHRKPVLFVFGSDYGLPSSQPTSGQRRPAGSVHGLAASMLPKRRGGRSLAFLARHILSRPNAQAKRIGW